MTRLLALTKNGKRTPSSERHSKKMIDFVKHADNWRTRATCKAMYNRFHVVQRRGARYTAYNIQTAPPCVAIGTPPASVYRSGWSSNSSGAYYRRVAAYAFQLIKSKRPAYFQELVVQCTLKRRECARRNKSKWSVEPKCIQITAPGGKLQAIMSCPEGERVHVWRDQQRQQHVQARLTASTPRRVLCCKSISR